MQEKIRTFICIDFPDSVIKEIARLHPLLKNVQFNGKLTELENLHLTLKFLGEITKEELEKVKTLLSTVSPQRFKVKLGFLGAFYHGKQPKIIWIKILGREILELQNSIDESLSQLFQKEKRFMSHLTVTRIKHVPSPEIFKEKIKNIKIKPIQFEVDSFRLKSSVLQSLGPMYTTLGEYPLK